jgi:EAL domain-containing protein (putative c-di-GMP-specific phosphodiesterase class I)
MTTICQTLCVGVRPEDLGIGPEPLLPAIELDFSCALDAKTAKSLLLHPERWDLVLCDASRYFELSMDRRLSECGDDLLASTLLLRSGASLLSPVDAASRGAVDLVTYGDREHLAMVVFRELAACIVRKQLREALSIGRTVKSDASAPKITDIRRVATTGADPQRDQSDAVRHHASSDAARHREVSGRRMDPGAVLDFIRNVEAADEAKDTALPELDDDLVRSRIEAGGLTLEYQPIVPLKKTGPTRALFEVLSRLRDENGLSLPPRRFFPAITRNRWLGQLDLWVFRRALPILARVQETNSVPTRFYINLSPDTLRESKTADAILELIEGAQIQPDTLVVEIRKESFDAPESLTRLAECLAQNGHGLLLEQFGPADSEKLEEYSAWLNQVKLDSRVLEALDAGKVSERDVQRLVRSAQNKGMQVIGLAVDNAPLLMRLYEIGVDFVQGHFVSMPYAQLVYPDVPDIDAEETSSFIQGVSMESEGGPG